MLHSHSDAVHCSMSDHLDGHLILHHGRYSVFGSGGRDRIGTHATHTHGDKSDSSAHSHTAEDITFARNMRSVVLLQMLLDDCAFLAGVVDRRCCHGYANRGDTHRQGHGEAGDSSRCRGTGDKARIMLPFSLKLFGCQPVALLVVRLEVERHDGSDLQYGVENR